MKPYALATGVIFGLVTLVHVWRMVEEPHLAREPWFLALTILPAALSVIGLRLARRANGKG